MTKGFGATVLPRGGAKVGGPVKGAVVVGGLTTGQSSTWQHRSMGSGTLWHVAGTLGTRAHLLVVMMHVFVHIAEDCFIYDWCGFRVRFK